MGANDKDAPCYMQYLVQSKGDNALLANIAYSEEGGNRGIPQYYRLNLQNYQTEIISSTEGKNLYKLRQENDDFDLNNFIAKSLDYYSKKTEIGLFQDTYTSLIEDSSASVLFDSIQDNKCVYCIECDSSKNDPNNMRLSDSVSIMDRDGTNKKAILLGTEAVITKYCRLTSTIGCIYAYNAGPERLCITALINFDTEQVKLFMESGKAYDVKGIINDSFLMIESDIQAGTSRFFLVNSDGTENPDLFQLTVKNVFGNRYSLVDVKENRFFYAFINLDNFITVCCYNFSTMELYTVLPSDKNPDNTIEELPNSRYSTPFRIIKETNTLSFVLSDQERNEVWYLINLDTKEVESVLLPKNTDTTLSSDGKYVLCANTNGKNRKNGIIAFDVQIYTPFSEKLDLGVRSGLYNPVMQEFIVPLKNDVDGNALYRVNANGEINKILLR